MCIFWAPLQSLHFTQSIYITSLRFTLRTSSLHQWKWREIRLKCLNFSSHHYLRNSLHITHNSFTLFTSHNHLRIKFPVASLQFISLYIILYNSMQFTLYTFLRITLSFSFHKPKSTKFCGKHYLYEEVKRYIKEIYKYKIKLLCDTSHNNLILYSYTSHNLFLCLYII